MKSHISRTFLSLAVAVALSQAAGAGTLSGCGGCPNPSFGPAGRGFALPQAPKVIVTADFNGDGNPDVAVGLAFSVAIFLGKPGGDYQPSASLLLNDNVGGMAAADVDGDGNTDLIVLGQYAVRVFHGLGNGTFAGPEEYYLPTYGSRLAVGDLNGDRRPDLLITISNTGYVVFLNDGKGDFAPLPVAGSYPTSNGVLLADFNGDKKLDALFLSQGPLLLGNGDGTFADDPLPVPVGSRAVAVDLDRDGKMDIAYIDGLKILRGHGDGTFDPPVTIPTPGYQPALLGTGDFNGDGWPDLVVSAYTGSVLLVLSDGSGGFLAPAAYVVGPTPSAMLAADLDGDGIPDVLVGSEYDYGVTLYRGKPGGSLEVAPVFAASARVLASADFNGDLKPDLVAGGEGVSIWIGDGNGGFSSTYSSATPTQVQAVAAAELNGDSKMDFAVVTWVGFFPQAGKLQVFLGNGSGGASPLPEESLNYVPVGLRIANLDADGIRDLVISSDKGIHVLQGAGNGTFSELGVLSPAVRFGAIAVADLNGDSKLDIAAATAQGVTVFLGNGDGTFQAGTDYLIGTSPSSVIIGEFNGDGKTDLVTGNSNGSVSFLRGRGDGTFEPSFTFSNLPGAYQNGSADFNGDGKLDITSRSIRVMTGNGDGSFALPSITFVTGVFPNDVLAGDWNGDGKPDLAVAGNGGISIFLNTNCEARRLAVTTEPATCAPPGNTFSVQPVVHAVDDGGNTVACAGGSVTASLAPGTGTAGAQLGGTTSRSLSGGAAVFTDLSIDLAGAFYEIEFQYNSTPPTRSRPVSVHSPYVVSITGPASFCPFQTATYSVQDGFDTHVWSLDGNVLGTGSSVTLSQLAAGGHTLSISVAKDGCAGAASLPLTVLTCPAQPSGLSVDSSPDGTFSDGNGVLEPGERVFVAPMWQNVGGSPLGLTGDGSNFGGPPGPAYTLFDGAADYGTIAPGASVNCASATGNCYEVGVSAPPTRPAAHWDATLTETLSDGDPATVWRLHIGSSFADVPRSHVFYRFIETLLHNGITTGCAPSAFCPEDTVFRLQMAVFLSRALAGGDDHVPATGKIQGNPYVCLKNGHSFFFDVAPENPFCRHAHYIYAAGVTTGCEPNKYCPDSSVTRAQMTLFVARAIAGSDAAVPKIYGPDPVTGRSYNCDPASPNLHFTDVTTSDIFCRHTHYLWARDVISGFPDGSYGPNLLVTRGAMAKFLSNGFGLRLYGP